MTLALYNSNGSGPPELFIHDIFINENASENVVCKTAAILSRGEMN